MKIHVILDGKTYPATLADNPSAEDLFNRLPISLPLEDYAASEKIAHPSFKLNTSQAPARYQAKPGDITYYAPWGNFALFYKSGPSAAGLVHLGQFDGDFSALSQATSLTLERAPSP
ncbi:cyclophilin-like fold protein [Testudinibacter sp. P27/CKL/0425]